MSHEILFDPPVANQQSSIARMFLVGCSADGKIFDCKITGKSFTPTALTVIGYVGGSNVTNGKIFLSYIIFSPSLVSLSSYGGLFDKENFQGSYSSDVKKIIYRANNFLYGFSILSFKAENGQKINITIDNDEVMTIEAERDVSFRLIYIALGLSSKESCPEATAPYEYQDQCLASCPENSYAHGYSNGGHACLSCSEKLNLIFKEGKCVCKDGYLMEQSECIKQAASETLLKVQKIEPPKRQEI